MALATRVQEWQAPRRKRWSRAEGEEVVEAFEASGMGVAAFAAKHGLVDQRVRRWLIACGGKEHAGEGIAFAPVRLVAARSKVVPMNEGAGGGVIEVVLRAGRVVRVSGDFDPESLRRVVRALEAGEEC